MKFIERKLKTYAHNMQHNIKTSSRTSNTQTFAMKKTELNH